MIKGDDEKTLNTLLCFNFGYKNRRFPVAVPSEAGPVGAAVRSVAAGEITAGAIAGQGVARPVGGNLRGIT